MISCKKQCCVRKLRIGFRLLFWASCFFTALEILTLVLIALCYSGAFPERFSLWLASCAETLVPSGFTGLKDVSMTVGLTGVLFAWLLQIIGDQVCGIQMDELFRTEFHGYTFQVFFFIQATLVCIFTCSAQSTWKLVAPTSFVNMICGIVGMWLMCLAFLFSTKKRRIIAFCALEGKLTKEWSTDHQELWSQELNLCAARGEEEHIETYFQQLRSRAEKLWSEEPAEVCAEYCGDMIGRTWEQVGHKRWSQYLPYLLKQPYGTPASYLLLSSFLLQAARLQEIEQDGERYQAVMECLSRGTKGMEKVPGDLLALYLAFIVVYQAASEKPIPRDVHSCLQEIRWDLALNITSMAKYQACVLKWVIWSYGIAVTYDYKSFTIRMQHMGLDRDFTRFMKLYPWKLTGKGESSQ